MKCPERYIVVQTTSERGFYNEDGLYIGKVNGLYETQLFAECYEENCVAWDKEQKCCRKMVVG